MKVTEQTPLYVLLLFLALALLGIDLGERQYKRDMRNLQKTIEAREAQNREHEIMLNIQMNSIANKLQRAKLLKGIDSPGEWWYNKAGGKR